MERIKGLKIIIINFIFKKENGPCLAEKLFEKLPKTDETYSYLICGLCKFPSIYSITKAKILYQVLF